MPVSPTYVIRTQDICTCLEKREEALYAGCDEGTIKVYDVVTMRPQRTWKAHAQQVLNVSTGGKGELITQGREGAIAVWSTEGSCIRRAKLLCTGFCRFKLTSDKRYCAVSLDDQSKIACLDTTSLQEIKTFQPTDYNKKGMCWSVAVGENNSSILAGYESGHLVHFDRRFSKTPVTEVKIHDEIITAVDECKDQIITGSADGTLSYSCIRYVSTEDTASQINKLQENRTPVPPQPQSETTETAEQNTKDLPDKSGSSITQLQKVNVACKGVAHLRFRSDSRLFGAGCWDGGLRLYSCKSRKLLTLIPAHDPETVTDMVMYDTNCIITSGRDKRLAFWTVY